jgi:thiamine biosynthesis lipoprotein ApbE/predicted RND superfamily exporter protein
MKRSHSWFWLAFLLLAVLGIARIRFDIEILNLLPTKLPVAQGLQIYQQHFSDARELIITLEATTADDAEAAARALAQVLRSRTQLVAGVTWQPSWMENPAQATELLAFLWLNQPPAALAVLTNRLAPGNLTNVLREAREQLASSLSPSEVGMRGYDPYGLMQLPESVAGAAPSFGRGEELFAARDGTFRLLFVQAATDLTSYRACRTWLAEIQNVIAGARQTGDLPAQAELHFTGRPAFVTEIAGGMENDTAGSAGGTLVTIGVLFWLTHRRVRPLCWLLFLLIVILAGTTAMGGLFLGTVNVVSMGFASILLGLAEDFGIVIYQESRSHPELGARELRHEVAPGIFWSAVTTAGAFLTLNLSTLPGLGQLGTLVAIGIILAAVVMLYGYLPPLLRMRRARDTAPAGEAGSERFLLFMPHRLLPASAIWVVSALLLVGAGGLVWKNGPRFDHSTNPLKPKHSEANATLERIKNRFGRAQEPLWVLVPGADEHAVARGLTRAESVLSSAKSNGLIASYTLPTALWPQPDRQQANRPAVAALLAERSAMRAAALELGFTTNSLFAADSILDCWQRAVRTPGVFWPTNQASRWILGKMAARSTNGWLALGFIHPTNAAATKTFAASWPADLQRDGILLSGWELLGSTVFDTVVREFPRVFVPIFLLVVISLWLAFRNWREVGLSLFTLLFSGVCLWGAMDLLHWDWNILNLMALPLLLGMGVDFSIHMQLALRRYDGDRLVVRRSVGRALLLAGATTIAGFGSLSFSTNAGMASLGQVCALGITLALITAVYLLPVWWNVGRQSDQPPQRVAGVAVLLLLCALSCVSCRSRPDSAELQRFEYQRPEMGLPFRIVLYASGPSTANPAAEAAFRRIEDLNGMLSDYDTDSELSRLSRTSGEGRAVRVGSDLWRVLERAQELAERSGGAFDVTVGPCVNLWRRARREQQMPDPARLEQARRAVGYGHVRLDARAHTVELLVPDMRLDLGGIAKGYALDEAMVVLKRCGIRSALVSGGGDMVVSGPPPGRRGWRIELAPLDASNAPPARFVLLSHAALATSGDLFQRLEIEGKRYSHIVDPRTGIGLVDHSLVNVIARDGMTADSLTKVVSVLGPKEGLAFISRERGVETRIVRQPAEAIEARESPGFSRYYDSNP